MNLQNSELIAPSFSLVAPAPHSLHEVESAHDFSFRFEIFTGTSVEHVTDGMITPETERAIFLVGSIPLGMATSASDIDFIVLVDSKKGLIQRERGAIANTNKALAFCNEENSLIAGTFVTLMNDIGVEMQIAIAPVMKHIYQRLRARGPELSESEIQTLGRLSTGWLLWQTDGYLDRNAIVVKDSALDVYCSTRLFVDALILRRKALKARDLDDSLLAFHLGRASVEKAYLAYFSSEGISYLGPKWVAKITGARDAKDRLHRHPLINRGSALLFPMFQPTQRHATLYLEEVSNFLVSMRNLIEQRRLFRIAFHACPQIYKIE